VLVEAAGVPENGLIISRDSAGRWLYFADHWPNRARFWLPTIDHPSDKATVEWRVHAPASSTVIANGRLREDRSPLPNEPHRAITVFQTERPIPTYLMVIGVAPLARLDLGATACGLAENGGCVDQDVYEAPELAPRVPPGFGAAGRIVEWLSRSVGPFPYEKLSHVQSSTQFGGMENASAIFYSDRAFRTMSLGEGLVAHETAHQWFGNAVTAGRSPGGAGFGRTTRQTGTATR
jgi:aminopeptidase N